MKKLLCSLLLLSLFLTACGSGKGASEQPSKGKKPETVTEDISVGKEAVEDDVEESEQAKPQEQAKEVISASYGHIGTYQPEIFGRIDIDTSCGYDIEYWDYPGKDDPHYTVLVNGSDDGKILVTVGFMDKEVWGLESTELNGLECIDWGDSMLIKAFDITLDTDEYDVKDYTVYIQQSYTDNPGLVEIQPSLFEYMAVDPGSVSIYYEFKDIEFPFTVLGE